jgi:hypothetical protein
MKTSLNIILAFLRNFISKGHSGKPRDEHQTFRSWEMLTSGFEDKTSSNCFRSSGGAFSSNSAPNMAIGALTSEIDKQ